MACVESTVANSEHLLQMPEDTIQTAMTTCPLCNSGDTEQVLHALLPREGTVRRVQALVIHEFAEHTEHTLQPSARGCPGLARTRNLTILAGAACLAALLWVSCPSMASSLAQRRRPTASSAVAAAGAPSGTRPTSSRGAAATTGRANVAILAERSPVPTTPRPPLQQAPAYQPQALAKRRPAEAPEEALAPARRQVDTPAGSWGNVLSDVIVIPMSKGNANSASALSSHKSKARNAREWLPRNVTWQVVHPDFVNVRSGPHIWTRIIEMKRRCMQVRGAESKGWVKLAGVPGYIKTRSSGIPLVRVSAITYLRIHSGNCADHGYYPINERGTCENAALALGLQDVDSHIIRDLHRPEGCYFLGGKLFFSVNPKNKGNGADDERDPLCADQDEPVLDPCHGGMEPGRELPLKDPDADKKPLGPWSLFCFTVILMTGYGPELLKVQVENYASIFRCEKYMVVSVGGKMTLGAGWNTTEIEAPEGGFDGLKGGAELNMPGLTETFLKAWDEILKHPAYKLTGWTVKVDADTVFFPHRLKMHLHQSGAKDGARTYFLNCDRYPGRPKLLGAVEVFSREAMERYAKEKDRCGWVFGWHRDWAEEMYMQQCMRMLKAKDIFDGNLVGDDRCRSARCSDASKVAIHSYDNQDPEKYMQCWDEADANSLTELLH